MSWICDGMNEYISGVAGRELCKFISSLGMKAFTVAQE